jgi:hypothetical protein
MAAEPAGPLACRGDRVAVQRFGELGVGVEGEVPGEPELGKHDQLGPCRVGDHAGDTLPALRPRLAGRAGDLYECRPHRAEPMVESFLSWTERGMNDSFAVVREDRS